MTAAPPINHADLFSQSPIAILCEDWAGLREAVLRDTGGDEARLDVLLAERPDYLADLRREHHRFVDANPAALTLLGVRDLAEVSRRAPDILPVDPRGHLIRAMLQGESVAQGERDLRNAHGVLTPILWRATLPTNPAAYARLYFCAIDISAQRQAQESLDSARSSLNHAGRLSLVGELVASVTHEIAQPVSSINLLAAGATRWLEASPAGVEEAHGFLLRITRSASHAGQIIARIRDFSRAAGTAHPQPVSPALLVQEACGLIEHEARRHQVRLRVALGSDLPQVMADPLRIKQVLVNVALNAIQALAGTTELHRAREITFGARVNGDQVRFCITDTGPGLAEDARAFEPFWSTRPDGLGLGLAISRRIVEDHRGTMHLASSPAGTRVVFTLPVAGSPAAMTAE